MGELQLPQWPGLWTFTVIKCDTGQGWLVISDLSVEQTHTDREIFSTFTTHVAGTLIGTHFHLRARGPEFISPYHSVFSPHKPFLFFNQWTRLHWVSSWRKSALQILTSALSTLQAIYVELETHRIQHVWHLTQERSIDILRIGFEPECSRQVHLVSPWWILKL